MARSPRRLHQRSTFFKYMSSSTARIVLRTRALRWSSPTLFNDPFDVPRELAHGVSSAAIGKALARRLAALMDRPPEDLSGLHPRARLVVHVAQGMTVSERAHVVAGLGADGAPQESGGLEELRTLWKGFIPDFRILCLTEDPASASMWSNYAAGFSGCVLELACRDDLDSPWLQAKPVLYTTPVAEMFSADELAQILLMPQPAAQEAILDWGTFRKSPEWSNEREWRVVSSRRPSDLGDHSDWPFHPGELQAVYIGPRMSPADRQELEALATSFPNARVIRVEIGPGQGLVFTEDPPGSLAPTTL